MRSATYQIYDLERIVKNARDQEYDVTIRRWQRNPPTDLFFGNDLQCCVAIENFNGFGMLQFLTGMEFELDEIIDTQTGERVGGTFDFIQERIDSNPERPVLSYVNDNMELNPSHQFLRKMIRDTKTEMSTEVFGRMIVDDKVVNNGVRLGTSYNDVPTDDLRIVTETVRKVGGSNCGIAVYTDTAVQAAGLGVSARNPTAFLKAPTYLLDGEPPAEIRSPIETTGHLFIADLRNPEVRRGFREQYLQQATTMEESLFGVWSSVELLNHLFADELSPELENTIFCFSADEDKLLGFIIGVDATRSRGVPTLYVETSNVDWNYQNRGVGKGLRKALEEKARERGYQQVSRDAMADTGYAQRLLRELMSAGALVEPALHTEAELQAFLSNRDSFHTGLGGRQQISILSSL